MKKIAPLSLAIPAAALLALGNLSCKNKMKMPELHMPKMLEEEKPEVRIQKSVAEALKAEDQSRYFKDLADLLDLARDLKWDKRRLAAELLDYSTRIENADQAQRYLKLLDDLRIPRT